MPDQERLIIGLMILAFGYILLGIGLGFIFGAALSLFMASAPFLVFGFFVAAPELYKLIKNR
jgi:hypothetical protein